MSKQISFVAEDDTIDLIERLKKELNAPTTAAVFRKALALTKLAAEQARGSEGIVSVRGRSQDEAESIKIALNA
jgi:hypothetical protein